MNNSKYYYLSNENMSGIQQEIGEYSMNFQKQSYRPGQSKQEISQMIGSMSHNSKINSMSQRDQFRKPTIQNKIPEKNPSPPKKENVSMPIQQQSKKPIYLGDTISKTIKQRYYQINKITTDDPDVLFDFYNSQRKTFNKNNTKDMQTTIQKIKDLMPTMQRKMLNKIQFEKLLMYYPMDVQYTLYCDANSIKKDKQLNQKVQVMNKQAKKHQGKKKLDVNKMIERLYGETVVRKQKQNQKLKRLKFGKNLSQHFQNAYRNSNPVETVDKLYSYWDDCYEREEFGIEWDEETAKQAIRLYMIDQIQELFMHSQRKLGYKCDKVQTLWKFFKQHPQLQYIHIPTNSFQEYAKVYNDFLKQKIEKQNKRQVAVQRNSMIKQKKDQVKKFGRPVSATPLTILSKPKQQHAISQKMLLQYGNDQVISQLAYKQRVKGARYPFQYGIYDVQDEIKTKQRIKPNPKKQYDKTIQKALMSTFTKGFNNHSSMYEKQDRVFDILGQQNIQLNDNWKQLSPILEQALQVKAYDEKWFRDCLVRYAQKISDTDLKLEQNKVIIKKIMKKFNDYSQSQRRSQLAKFESFITASQAIAEKKAKIQNLGQNSQKQYEKNKKQCFVKLQDKAIEFIQLRRKHSYDQSFSLRDYLNEIFQKLLKEHKVFIKKHYHVVQGQKQCPKLLKYHFFRLIKEINQFALQRDHNAKSHAWIPTKSNPQNFNYKTYNQFANYYTKNRNIIAAKQQTHKHKTSIWGRQKCNSREKLLMTYDDAKQCTFEPRFSRKAV